MVFTSVPAVSYTVMVWRYIMFCANTRPLSVATTDFGEIAPVTVLTSRRGRSTAGCAGVVLVVVDDVEALVGVARHGGVVEAPGCARAERGCDGVLRASTPNTIAAPMSVTTK